MRPLRTSGIFHTVENFSADFPRYGKKFSTPWKTQSTHCTQHTAVGNFFSALSNTSVRCAQHVAMRQRMLQNDPVRRAQHVVVGGFFDNLSGLLRGNNREFFEDGAGQTTRAVLVYARGRLSRARTEKATVGFRADKSPKKPPFFCCPSTAPCPLTSHP